MRTNAPIRWLLTAAVLVTVAGGAYVLGRQQGGREPVVEAAAPAQPVAAARPESGLPGDPHAKPENPQHPSGGVGPLRKFVHFQVGQRNVKALLQDGETTWIGTSGGLIKYLPKTGNHKVYDNRGGLLSNGVFYLGKFGREIWVGTYGGGLSILDPEKETWRNYNIPNGMGDAFVYDVLHSSNGDLWIATWSGVNRIDKGEIDRPEAWELYTVENTAGGLPNDWVYGLAEGSKGEIWMATEGGLARFDDGNWTNWNHADGLGADYETVAADIEFKNDPADFSDHHARQKKEQGLEDVKIAYNPNYIVALVVDRSGVVWAGTWGGGLSRFDGDGWQTFTKKDGLPANHVFTLAEDGSGNIWIGTSRGLAKYDGRNFAAFGAMDGLFAGTVFSMSIGPDESTWVGSFGGAAWFPRGIRSHAAAQ
jgi:ligand-binding sensor domain-containing protein